MFRFVSRGRWRRRGHLLRSVRLRSYPMIVLVHYLARRSTTSDRLLLPVHLRARPREAPFWLRWSSSDARVFLEVFADREYDLRTLDPTLPVRTILDLGGNIGAAAVDLLGQYPEAKLISVEPSPTNLSLLRRNAQGSSGEWEIDARAVSDRTGSTLLYASGWHSSDSTTSVVAQERQAAPDRAEHRTAQSPIPVPCTTVASLLAEHGLTHLDICKIDVEGAEQLIFGKGQDLAWLRHTNAVIIELHDRYIDASLVRGSLRDAGFIAKRTGDPAHRAEIFVRSQ